MISFAHPRAHMDNRALTLHKLASNGRTSQLDAVIELCQIFIDSAQKTLNRYMQVVRALAYEVHHERLTNQEAWLWANAYLDVEVQYDNSANG